MTTYLDDFAKKQFTTHSSPEYFNSDFQATQGDGILNKIDHQLLLDINDKIIDLAKIDIQSGCVKNTHATNLRILGKLKYGLTLVTAEKVFLFGAFDNKSFDEWTKKSYKITEEPDDTIKLFNGMWVFTFSTEVGVGAYDSKRKTLEVKPLFWNFNPSTKAYELFSSGEEEMKAILNRNPRSPCICNAREEENNGKIKAIMYGKCCKPELFSRRNRFGACEVDILRAIGPKIDSLSPKEHVSIFGPPELKASYLKAVSGTTNPYAAARGEGLGFFFTLLANTLIPFNSKSTEEGNVQHSIMAKEIDLYYLGKGIRRALWVVRDHEGLVVKAAFSSVGKINQYKDALIMLNMERGLKEIADLMDKVIRSYPKFLEELSKTMDEWDELSQGNKKMIITAFTLAETQQFHAASYILAPQIEGVLRTFAKHKGIKFYKIHIENYKETFSFEYKVLGSLIRELFNDGDEKNRATYEVTNTDEQDVNTIVENESEDDKLDREEDEYAEKAKIKENYERQKTEGQRIGGLLLSTLTNDNTKALNLRNNLLHNLEGEDYEKYEFYILFYLIILIRDRSRAYFDRFFESNEDRNKRWTAQEEGGQSHSNSV